MPEIDLVSSAGRLRALHDPPEAPPPARGPRGALVCHPHPLHGGTMDNKVVFTVARRLRERGLHVLRFNFRGAGGSEGDHDLGIGERDDVRAALDRLEALVGPAAGPRTMPGPAAIPGTRPGPAAALGPLLVAGFSFGSFVGLSVGIDDPRVGALLAIAPPVTHYDYAPIAGTHKPLGVVYARADELVPARAVEAWIARCARPPHVVAVDGAGHLFHGRLDAIRAAVDAFVDGLE